MDEVSDKLEAPIVAEEGPACLLGWLVAWCNLATFVSLFLSGCLLGWLVCILCLVQIVCSFLSLFGGKSSSIGIGWFGFWFA